MRLGGAAGGHAHVPPRHIGREVSAFGIEEEFFLYDRHTGLPATPSHDQVSALTRITAGGGCTSTEWLACQIETSSPVLHDGTAALESLHRFRRNLAATADGLGMDALGIGTAPRIPRERATVTAKERYDRFVALAPGFAADQYISGMHVHVSIPDRDTGVRALNGLRPWLPALTALGANSPLWRGQDSGFASWRAIHYSRWMASGPPPHFEDASDYEARVSALLESDVVFDRGCLNWLARLPERLPTLEVRACDVQLQADDTVTLALLTRALVEAAMEEPPVTRPIPAERLDIAQWQAARYGVDDRLFDPARCASLPAADVVWGLFAHVRPYFADADEESFVRAGLDRFLSHGTGASRQRIAFSAEGIDGVLRYAASALTS